MAFKKLLAIPKDDYILLVDCDDEDDEISDLKEAFSEGTAYPMLGTDCVLQFIRLLPNHLKWKKSLLRVFIYFNSNFTYIYLYIPIPEF